MIFQNLIIIHIQIIIQSIPIAYEEDQCIEIDNFLSALISNDISIIEILISNEIRRESDLFISLNSIKTFLQFGAVELFKKYSKQFFFNYIKRYGNKILAMNIFHLINCIV